MDLSCPIKDIPECWSNEKRMNSLFAPFRKKEINPVDWESKMKFWHTVIEKWCLEKNMASFSTQIIQKEFKRNGRTPVCIATAVQELSRNGDVRLKSEFLAVDPNQGWTGWAVDSFVKTPVCWSLNKLKSYWTPQDNSIQPETEFVHMGYLKVKGEELHSMAQTMEQELISLKQIGDMLSNDVDRISDDTVNCIVHYLQLEGSAAVETVGNVKLVKLFVKGKDERKEISQADLAVFKLEQNRAVLETNIEHLERERNKCIQEAKAYICKKNMDHVAKSWVRKSKQLDKLIEKRGQALDNLESLLSNLKNTESDSKVIEAYRVGLAALKGSFKSSGLSEDGVFETMAQLQEMNDIQDEIQMALSQPIVSGTSDEDLEQELNDIIAKSNTELPDVPKNDLSFLPDVPTHSISSPPQKKKVPDRASEMAPL